MSIFTSPKFSIKNFNSIGQSIHNNINMRPRLGRGFVYRIEVLSKQGGSIKRIPYIGLTRRSVATRYKEHLYEARKLGILGPPVLHNAKELEFPRGKNPLYTMIRTAMGTTQDRTDENHLKYLNVEIVGEYSLVSLPKAESYFIGGNLASPSLLNNYEGLRKADGFNRTAQSSGFSWGRVSSRERAIASAIFLEEEAEMGSMFVKNPKLYYTALGSIYHNTDYTNTKYTNIPYMETILGHLYDYYNFGDMVELYIQKGDKESIVNRDIVISTLMRKTGQPAGGYTPEDLRAVVSRIKKMDMISRDDQLYNRAAQRRPVQPYTGAKRGNRKIAFEILDAMYELSQEIINDIEKKWKSKN